MKNTVSKKIDGTIKMYQSLAQGLSDAKIPEGVTKTLGTALMLSGLPVLTIAQGDCGAAGGVAVGGNGGTNVPVDIDGDGNNDFTFFAYGGFQNFMRLQSGVSVAFNGTRNGGYPIVDQLASGATLPGANAFSPGQAYGAVAYATFIDNTLAGNGMPWQEGETGFIAIKKGSDYGFIKLTVGADNTRTVTVDVDMTGFSTTGGDITVGDCTSLALPVELIQFSAEPRQKTIQLNWSTASEYNNAGFELQKSTDNRNFQSLTFIEGYGDTSEQQDYSFEDKDLRQGQLYYYRLKQIDFDGDFEYSNVVSAKVKENGVTAVLAPNPTVSGYTQLTYNTLSSGELKLSVFDVSGKNLFRQNYSVIEGTNTFDFDFKEFKGGVYFVKMEQEGQSIYQKLVIK